MSLPAGVFCCWLDNLTTDIWLSTAHPMSRKATGISLVGKGLFLRIFGVVPKPGEALKLDASRWSRHCQTCRSELNGSGVCRKCNVTRYAPGVLVSESYCHALVLDRKRLEDGK